MAKIRQSHNTGLLNYFDITQDGIYSIQKRISGKEIISKSLGLPLKNTLPLIKEWLINRTFKATCPWPDTPNENQHSPEMCYCQEIFECPTGDYILVLWKNDPTDSEGYRGLILDKNGKPSTYLNNSNGTSNTNVIWGHPCYYWVIPEKNLIISIKFPDSKCDNDLLKKWLKYVVRFRLTIDGYNSRQNTESSKLIKFSTPSTPEKYDYIYRFDTAIKEFNTSTEYLEAIANTTKTITIRNYVTTTASDEKTTVSDNAEKLNLGVVDTMQKIIDLFKKSDSEDQKDNSISKRKVEITIEGTPSAEIVKELLRHNDDNATDDWSDVIFTTEDDNNVSFKSHRLIERVTMSRTGDPYTGKEIYNAIKDSRSHYLARFTAPSKTEGADDT
ncbi:hypothetical protein, partial [Streptomyces sp. NPDC093594]|uniref:hypothetical protein n=1 Tax=Streptomyces sp. NPDC093594 TaxID=3155305 RepID=UPI00344BC505